VKRAACRLVLLLAALASCRSEETAARKQAKPAGEAAQAPARSHVALGPEAGALRAAFNADAGKVRLVVLVAPT
jgi:hypothetical protein